jgi:hypothetical protein
MRPPGWFRVVRAGAFAAVCVVLSQFGHDVMAARPAPLWAGWTALAGVGAAGYRLADRRRPAWWILLAVQVTQIGLHVWFSRCTSEGAAPVTTHMRMGGGVMHAAGGMTGTHGMSLGMLGAHALAGCLAAAWLYAGERALWRALRVVAEVLADRTLRVLALPVRTCLPAGPSPVRSAHRRGEDELAPDVAVLRHVLVRRGPPEAKSLFASVRVTRPVAVTR